MYTMGGKLTYTSAGLKGHYQAPDPLPGTHSPLPAGAPDLGPPYALYLWGILCPYLSIFDSWAPGWYALGNNSDQRTFLALSLLMIYFTNAPTQLSCTTLGMRTRLRSSVYVQKRVNFSQKKKTVARKKCHLDISGKHYRQCLLLSQGICYTGRLRPKGVIFSGFRYM